MGGIPRRRVQRALDHLGHLRIRYCAWSARTIFISQPFNAILHEATSPFAHRMLVNTEAFGNFLALQSLCTQQNHPATIGQRTRRFVPPNLTFEKKPILHAQYNQIRLSARHSQCPCLVDKGIYNDAYCRARTHYALHHRRMQTSLIAAK
jgi:hypothetical protein